MKNHKEEFLMILKAIRTVRARWIKAINSRAVEIQKLHPEKSSDEARSAAMTSSGEVFEEYGNLLNLYALIGSNVKVYAEVLEGLPRAEVIPIGKKAA